MIIPDTSVWIKYFRTENPYTSRVRELMFDHEVLAISAAFGELIQGVRTKREYQTVIQIWEILPKVDESEFFIQAGIKSWRHKFVPQGIGLIDAYLLYGAEKTKSQLWTLDKKLKKVIPDHLLFVAVP